MLSRSWSGRILPRPDRRHASGTGGRPVRRVRRRPLLPPAGAVSTADAPFTYTASTSARRSAASWAAHRPRCPAASTSTNVASSGASPAAASTSSQPRRAMARQKSMAMSCTGTASRSPRRASTTRTAEPDPTITAWRSSIQVRPISRVRSARTGSQGGYVAAFAEQAGQGVGEVGSAVGTGGGPWRCRSRPLRPGGPDRSVRDHGHAHRLVPGAGPLLRTGPGCPVALSGRAPAAHALSNLDRRRRVAR